MEGGERNREFNLALRMDVSASDLQQNCMKRSHNDEEGDEEIELSLGLSMNGRFGVDPMRKKLKRSSSIANLVFPADNGSAHPARAADYDSYGLLPRTRSLPTEAEEEWRRRKEYQSMRRMEAKKKRMEKLKIMRGLKGKEIVLQGGNGVHINSENGNEIASPQGSVGSHGSASSGISDVDFLQQQGAKQNVEAPPSVQHCSQNRGDQEPASDRDAIQSLKDPMLEMPYVFTKREGPNTKAIEGFLYRYKKGEEVRIVCVCHGEFLTPAEFVKHGGGGDVEHPLKHIVVNPFPVV